MAATRLRPGCGPSTTFRRFPFDLSAAAFHPETTPQDQHAVPALPRRSLPHTTRRREKH